MTVNEKKKKILVIDARSYGAALANRAKGGGFEGESYGASVSEFKIELVDQATRRNAIVVVATTTAFDWHAAL